MRKSGYFVLLHFLNKIEKDSLNYLEMFPTVIASIIADYCAKPVLRDWIRNDMILELFLRSNPLAVEAGLIAVDKYIPNPIGTIQYYQLEQSERLWCDDKRINEMFTKNGKIKPNVDLRSFSLNRHPRAVRYLIKHNKMLFSQFISNPSAIQWIRENLQFYGDSNILLNPAAIDIIKEHYCINGRLVLTGTDSCNIVQNPHPWVIEQIKQSPYLQYTYPAGLSLNPGIFEYQTDPNIVIILTQI